MKHEDEIRYSDGYKRKIAMLGEAIAEASLDMTYTMLMTMKGLRASGSSSSATIRTISDMVKSNAKLGDYGADIYVRDQSNGQSLLHYAVCSEESEAVINALIDVGLNPNHKDDAGRSALELLLEDYRDNPDVAYENIMALLDQGASLYVKSASWKSAIRWMSDDSTAASIKKLLENYERDAQRTYRLFFDHEQVYWPEQSRTMDEMEPEDVLALATIDKHHFAMKKSHWQGRELEGLALLDKLPPYMQDALYPERYALMQQAELGGCKPLYQWEGRISEPAEKTVSV